MRRLVVAAGVTIGALLILMLLAVTMTAASYPATVQQINQADVVPMELREPIQAVAEGMRIPWEDLAAYLQITRNYQIPVPGRMQLVSDWAHLTPSDRQTVEVVWRQLVLVWLGQHLAEVGTDLAARIPADRRQEFDDLREALRAGEQMRTQDMATWSDITEGEAYAPSLALLEWLYEFPVAGGKFTDDWGFDRPQNEGYASTHHQGTDIFAPRGTTVRSVCEGTVEEAGWNYLGGWAVTVYDSVTKTRMYYAHLERFGPGITKGVHVRQGQILGYVGTSGEGPEGTTDHIADPHLHFGLYLPAGVVDPYPYLRKWQGHN